MAFPPPRKGKGKPPPPVEDEEDVDLDALMGMGGETDSAAPPMSEEGDEYADDELEELPEEGAASAVDPELLSYFEQFDDPNAPPEERASALEQFVRTCSAKSY
jgi:hypothetical protein